MFGFCLFVCFSPKLPSEHRSMVAVLGRTEISDVCLWSDWLAQGSSLPCALDCFGSLFKTPVLLPCKCFKKENQKQCVKFNCIGQRLWRASGLWNNAFYWFKDSEHIRYSVTKRHTLSNSFLLPFIIKQTYCKVYTWIYNLLLCQTTTFLTNK